jgi:hypothetical protein
MFHEKGHDGDAAREYEGDSMTALLPVKDVAEASMDELEPFFTSVRATNPFIDNRVTGFADASVDVDDIHRAGFQRLIDLAQQAVLLRRGIGAVLWGEAGIGKSHLLSRLARWAEKDDQATLVYLHNLQASPETLPRSVLRSVVSILTRGRAYGFEHTPLYRLVLAFVCEAMQVDSGVHSWSAVSLACSRLIDRLSADDRSGAAIVDRTVYKVLVRFFHSACRAGKTGDEEVARRAVRWLSGDYLDAEEAKRLGLPPAAGRDAPVGLGDNQQIKQVLVALCRMALSRKQPFLLCFDQVDNLDDEQAAALSRFLEALIDSAPDLLVVTAGIQATLMRWKESTFQESAWHRLAQFEIPLQRLTATEGRHIIGARLEKALTGFDELEPVRQWLHQDDLFLLGRAWAEDFFKDKVELRPREVVNGAREGWRYQQDILAKVGGHTWLTNWPGRDGPPPAEEWTEEQVLEAIDAKVDKRMSEVCEQLRQRADTLPPDADTLAGLVASLLSWVPGVRISRPPSGRISGAFPYSIMAHLSRGTGTDVQTGIRFLTAHSAHFTVVALRWLAQSSPCPPRILLVTDGRVPLALGKQANSMARQYFAELNQRDDLRFSHVDLTFDEYAAMHSLQAVIGMARSGIWRSKYQVAKRDPLRKTR